MSPRSKLVKLGGKLRLMFPPCVWMTHCFCKKNSLQVLGNVIVWRFSNRQVIGVQHFNGLITATEVLTVYAWSSRAANSRCYSRLHSSAVFYFLRNRNIFAQFEVCDVFDRLVFRYMLKPAPFLNWLCDLWQIKLGWCNNAVTLKLCLCRAALTSFLVQHYQKCIIYSFLWMLIGTYFAHV